MPQPSAIISHTRRGMEKLCFSKENDWREVLIQGSAGNRVGSGPGISGNLEMSGNFVALAKCQVKVREFREIWKSQGILTPNWEKSGNFTCVK